MTSSLGKRWKTRWVCGVAVAAAVFAGPSLAADLVRFSGGETITDADLSAYVFRRTDLRGAARSKEGIESILREMALARALAMEGERLQMSRTPGKESERFDDLFAHAVLAKLRPSCEPPPNAVAARKFFDENPAAFQVPPMARLSRVMLPASERVDGRSAIDWLADQAAQVAAGRKTMEDVAGEADALYKLEAQGDVGWTLLSGDNAIFRALVAAKPGETVGPLREGEFVYLFAVAGKREGRQLTWDEAATSSQARAVSYCRQVGMAKLEAELLAKYGVKFELDAIGAVAGGEKTAQ